MIGSVQLKEAFKLALSLVLFYWFALWMNWDMPKYGALAIVLISLGTTGASLRKGVMRIVGTTAGLAVGMVGIAVFSQDRFGTLLFLSAYLVVVGYFLPTSRYGYAWFVAGFLPPLIWATTYGDVDNAFHYAVFRYLETTAGITIYTLICAMLWPRSAGAALDQAGSDLWDGARKLFDRSRQQLDRGELPDDAPAIRAQLPGLASKALAALGAASVDTPSVIARRRTWEIVRVNGRAMCGALQLWAEGIDDCRQLDRSRLLPGLGAALDTLDARLARIETLWKARADDASVPEADDAALLAPLGDVVDLDAARDLAHFDRAALLGFAHQLDVLDETSRDLLRSMRVLVDLEPERSLRDRSVPADLFRPARWDPERLIGAVFPALCFAAAFLFWIIADPPSGPSVVSMAAIASLLVVMTQARALALLPVLLGTVVVVLAPVYFLVMPRLEGGSQLLALVFVYTFLFGLIGGRKPMIKTVALMLFAMMTGISNDQVYSFMGLVDGAFMFLLGFGITGVVQLLAHPDRPERVLVVDVRRFFRGCARITGAFGLRRADELKRGRALRKRWFESMILPVPLRLPGVVRKLDPRLFPDHHVEPVSRLLQALQSITFRLQAMELAHARVRRRTPAWTGPVTAMGRQLRERVQESFERWSRLEPVEALNEPAALEGFAREMEAQLDETIRGAHPEHVDDQALVDLYTFLGCTRGLVHAMGETHGAMARIDWDRLTEARF